MSKAKRKSKASAAATRKGRRAAHGYLAKGSNLGELSLMECFLQQHAKEIRERAEYIERIAKGLARIRDEIKANEAR